MSNAFLKSILLGATITPACLAMAQDAADAETAEEAANPPADTAQKKTVQLQTVIVTAGKMSEDLQKTALSATVLNGDSLKGRGLSNLATMIQDVPSVQIMGTGNANQGFFVAIRGVGHSPSFGQDSPVSLNINGVFQQRAQSVRGTFYDIDRIEVVRGPQGTLFGRNAEGGAVTVLTREPELEHSNGNATVELGNYNLIATQGAFNLPLSDTFALRLATSGEKRDGFLSNGDQDSDVLAGRARLLWQPSDDTKLILSAESMRTRGAGQGSANTGYIDYTQPIEYVNGGWWSAHPSGAWKNFRSTNWYLDFTHHFSFGTLYVQPTYYEALYDMERDTLNYSNYINRLAQGFTDSTARTMSTTNSKEASEQTQKTMEVRLTSPEDSRIRWVGGLYWYKMDEVTSVNEASGSALGPNGEPQPSTSAPANPAYASYYGIYPVAPSPQFVPQSPNRWTEDYAAYAKFTFPVTDNSRLVVGGRYTREEKWRNQSIGNELVNGSRINTNRYYLLDDGIENQTNTAASNRVYYTVPESRNAWSRLDYQTAFEYDITPDSMVYAGVSTGWKSGGFLTLPDDSLLAEGFRSHYDPEYLKSFEIGSKNTLLDRRLRINASVFLYDYQDYQFQYAAAVFDPAIGADPDFTVTYMGNAAEAKTFGAEIESSFLLTDNDRLNLNVSYLHARFAKFNLDNPSAASAALAEALVDQPLPRAPTWTFTPKYSHIFDLASGASLTASFDAHIQSDHYLSAVSTTSRYNREPGYAKYNASLNYSSPDGNWSALLYVRNITDRFTRTSTVLPTTYSGYGSLAYEPDAPRTFGASLTLNF